MRAWFFVLLLLPALAAAQGRTGEDEVIAVESGDKEMAAAIRRAGATLDDFLKIAAAPPAGAENFKLKVRVKDGKRVEHFWVTPFRVTDTGFEGTLANEPRVVRTVRLGQHIQFTRAEVTDWGYERDGRQVGSFTVCVLLGRMSKEQAEFYRRAHGFDCPEA